MPDAIDLSKEPTILEMQKMMKGLAAIVQQQTGTINQLNTTISEMSKSSGGGKAKEQEEEVDLENMKPADFQAFILKQVGGMLDEKLKGVVERVEGTSRDLNRFRVGQDAEKLIAKHKDFSDWNDEMAALAKVHPTLGLADLYRLARSGDEKKAKELDEKYTPKEEKKDDAGGLRLFGGFRPSKTTEGADGGEPPKKVTTTEALNKAWDEAVSEFPQLAKMGEDSAD